ncbi:NAD(P)H-binding protein [Latilactobacillus sakei]
MSKILVLGAAGQVAQSVIQDLLAAKQHELVLYLRNAERLATLKTNPHVTIIEGDVLDQARLTAALKGIDIVYANLGGEFEPLMKTVVKAMTATGVKRLIYISGLEVFIMKCRENLVRGMNVLWVTMSWKIRAEQRAVVEQSPLDYTILRCAYMTDEPIVDYELTEKGTPFKGTIISRQSIAKVVVDLIDQPTLGIRASWGINQPNTDGDRPVY